LQVCVVMALPAIHTLCWELQANRITPWTLSPLEAIPHVFTTNDDKLVWIAKTIAFIEVAALHYSEIDADNSVDLGSSVTVLAQEPPDNVGPPFFCVAVSMDRAFDLKSMIIAASNRVPPPYKPTNNTHPDCVLVSPGLSEQRSLR
jgi:hypothetical protein